ncbi:single-stranded DNA-binding protein [Corynebacterium glyciniphilum]|uniref:single-stranded DNA-binding protein n=1 Tax=Corynebacterium glyciniphilum TaxID=1404244 RepID=UPI003DA061B0
MATQQMSVTMTGFAATHPSRHPTIAKLVTFRMASTPSWNDNGEWKDSGTLFIEVQCWGRLGDHVMHSVVKGAPLVIVGRMNSYTYTPENPRTTRDGKEMLETVWRLTATNVGLDLSHSTSTWSLRDRIKESQEASSTQGDGVGAADASSFGGYTVVAASGDNGSDNGVGDDPTATSDPELAVAGDPSAPF